jgi:transcription initiation factor TFIID subunit 2
MLALMQEASGTPYEHVLEIESKQQEFEVQFKTKYKRIRRTTKRFHEREAAKASAEAAAMAELGETATTDYDMLYMDEEEKREWKFVKWGEIDNESNESSEFEFIRLDPDTEWLCDIVFKQRLDMWGMQLLKSHDVLAEIEAVPGLTRDRILQAASSTLTKVLNDSKFFYRVRMDSAIALSKCIVLAQDGKTIVGLHHLLKTLQVRFRSVSRDHRYYPQPNDFSNYSEYFVNKAIVHALSLFRLPEEKSDAVKVPVILRNIILNFLQYNDNGNNVYDDCYYMGLMIESLANTHIITFKDPNSEYKTPVMLPEEEASLKATCDELERLRKLDAMIPSYKNIISQSCLTAYMKLMLTGMLPIEYSLFLSYSRYGNTPGLRRVSFDALVLLNLFTDDVVTQYLMDTIISDPCPFIRAFVSRAFVHAFSHLAYRQESESILEMSYFVPDATDKQPTDPKHSDRIFDAIERMKNRYGQNEFYKKQLLQLLHKSMNDIRIYQDIHFICRLLWPMEPLPPVKEPEPVVEPIVEVQPVPVEVRVPSTPVPAEIPVPIPMQAPTTPRKEPFKIKLKLKRSEPEAATLPPPKRLSVSPVDPVDPVQSVEPVEVKQEPPTTPPPSSPLPIVYEQSATPIEIHSETVGPRDTQQENYLALLDQLVKHPDAFPFLNPVDPIRDGCPDYFTRILNPMDLSTIRSKVGTYGTTALFLRDLDLMFSNCYTYNLPHSIVHQMGKRLEASMHELWHTLTTNPQALQQVIPQRAVIPPNEPSLAITPIIKKTLNDLLNQLRKHKHAILFLDRVNEAYAPHYHTIVTNPMHINQVSKNLFRNTYQTTAEFAQDIRQIFVNYKLYNPPNDPVYQSGMQLETSFEQAWQALVASNFATEWKSFARGVVNKLAKLKCAKPFLERVDETKYGITNYYTIVQKPMYVERIKSKLARNEYASMDDVALDVDQIVINCELYNGPASEYTRLAKEMQEAFKELSKGYL